MKPASEMDSDSAIVDVINRDGSGPVVLVCEHASSFIPEKYENLGLAPDLLQSHIAWDPGALGVAKILSRHLDAPLIAQKISRLVYDCNRSANSPSAVPNRSEHHDIPGNQGLSAADHNARLSEVYEPFRRTLAAVLTARLASNVPTNLVTIHSYTPVFNNRPRNVDIGILHDVDTRLGDAMLDLCESEMRYRVRRNQPYGPEDGVTHTLCEHGIRLGLPNAMIEIRNDLIQDETGQEKLAGWLLPIIAGSLERVFGEQAPSLLAEGTTGAGH
jgi:predicted N-formylglutamate amidohydrolase